MTSVAHFHQILKKDFFNRIAFLRNYLSNSDILDAIESENYRWRKRICGLTRDGPYFML